MNPGPHGPEISAVWSTETVLGGFEFNSKASPGLWVRFRPPESPELLHELLHGGCAARHPGDVSVGPDHRF